MPTKKNQIKKIASLIKDGIEFPKVQMISGKKRVILTGDFVTTDLEAPFGEGIAFLASGEMGDKYSYHIHVVAVEN